MPNNLYSGMAAEVLVANLLRDAGFVILDQNFRFRHLEVDLVVIDQDVLCFVEVKARRYRADMWEVEHMIDDAKRRHITQAAECYLRMHPDHQHRPVRFDVALIYTPERSEPEVRYIREAFVPSL